MNERDFDEISRFLTMVGKATLFEYLELGTDASEGEVDQAIKARRAWAQGQQANPKYRGEALWIIKNVRAMRDALVDHKDQYLERVQSRDQEKNLEVLTLFIRGTLASGSLTPAGEAAILAQGRKLGLPDLIVQQRIRALAAEHGVAAGAAPSAAEALPDHYAVLGLSPAATDEEIELAYRARYRWARSLADTRRSREEYARLDAALRDLKDPARRAAYDQVRGGRPATPRPATPPDEGVGYLPPPADDPLTHPSTGLEPSNYSASLGSGGPRLAPARQDRAELTEPPGTPPPVRPDRADGAPLFGLSAPPGTPLPVAPEPVRPSAVPPEVRMRTAPPGTRAVPPPATPRREPVPRVEAEPARPGSAPGGEHVPRPDQVTGKTLSLAPARESTRLELASPATVSLRVGRSGEQARILLRQVGEGAVTGRVLADRDWVTVDPARLDPGKTQHTITARVHAERMPRQRGSSVVTIVPSHGPRLSVTIEAERRRGPSPAVLGGALLALLLLGLLGVMGWSRLHGATREPEALARALVVRPDPPTAMVFVDDKLIGPGEQRLEGSALGQGPVRVKVTLGGFDDFEQGVMLVPGEPQVVDARLELREPLAFRPSATLQGVALPRAQVTDQLAGVQGMVDRCFVDQAGAPDALRLRAYVGFSGQVEGVSPQPEEGQDPAFLLCVQRALRAMSFVLGEPADYYYFDLALQRPAGRTP